MGKGRGLTLLTLKLNLTDPCCALVFTVQYPASTTFEGCRVGSLLQCMCEYNAVQCRVPKTGQQNVQL